jgi:hypothetical protein
MQDIKTFLGDDDEHILNGSSPDVYEIDLWIYFKPWGNEWGWYKCGGKTLQQLNNMHYKYKWYTDRHILDVTID